MRFQPFRGNPSALVDSAAPLGKRKAMASFHINRTWWLSVADQPDVLARPPSQRTPDASRKAVVGPPRAPTGSPCLGGIHRATSQASQPQLRTDSPATAPGGASH